MRPPSVVFVEASAGGVVGGSLTATADLVRALDRRRVTPLLVRFAPSPLDAELRAGGIDLAVLADAPARRSAAGATRIGRAAERLVAVGRVTLPRARALARVFDERCAALVFAANGLAQNVDAVLAAAWRGLPVICHHRSERRLGPLERLASRWVDVGTGVTDRIVADAQARGARPRRWRTIADAIDADRVPRGGGPTIRRALGIAPEAPVVGMVGHVQPWKGQLLAVDAVTRARRTMPELRALLVGGEHASGRAYAGRLRERLARPDVGGAVHWLGERRDVGDCLDAMDVVLHASMRPEPFGRALLEAMAIGRPVVAPREGGPTVIVVDGETGLLVPPRDAAALAAAIVELLGDPERRAAMGRAAEDRVRRHFDLAAQARAVEGLIEETLATRAGR